MTVQPNAEHLRTMQRLVPGFIGMATPANTVYLHTFQKVGSAILGARNLSNQLRAVLMEIDFALFVEQLRADRWSACEEQIAEAALALKRAGANFLVITSNTGTTLSEAAREQSGLPVLDIVDTTLAAVSAADYRRPGLLSTVRTCESGVYQRAAAALGQQLVEAPQQLMLNVQSVILEELIRGVASRAALEAVTAAVDYFVSQGADCVVLGCTDLTHVAAQLQAMRPLPIFDSTILHAEAAAQVACGQKAALQNYSASL
ncbi:MAG TPA: aspartate/glutamate racemase family protein [Steroidobacteraceae bacterium]|nr:aspartate/glutamate racemase family protein [Steroidobacteraceae bacterium]